MSFFKAVKCYQTGQVQFFYLLVLPTQSVSLLNLICMIKLFCLHILQNKSSQIKM